MKLDPKIPSGPIQEKWDKHRFELKLVNPANKRRFDIIVVGSGLAGGSAAASFAELGYNVKCFCYQDSARRLCGSRATDWPISFGHTPPPQSSATTGAGWRI